MRPNSTGTTALWASLAAIVLVLSATAQAATVHSVEVLRYTAPDGETYFALPLGDPRQDPVGSARDVVILVDTSASQTGAHRAQALAVLDDLLASLDPADRVRLFAVDVQTTSLMADAAPVKSEAVRQAVARLRRRAPLGATRLVPALNAALAALPGNRPGSVLYIGDGMSSADLIAVDVLRGLLTKFHQRRLPVHSYGVGPRLDLQVLGVMAQQTGGMVIVDRGQQSPAEKKTTDAIGRRLADAVHASVSYPTKVMAPKGITLLPSQPLPLRGDRHTIYVGRGSLEAGAVFFGWLGDVKDSADVQWRVSEKSLEAGNSFLATLYRGAEATDGFTVALAGQPLLKSARHEFDSHIDGLLRGGETALRIRNFRQAERIGLAVRQLDPDNVRAGVLLGASERVQSRVDGSLVAAVQPAKQPADAEPTTETLDPIQQAQNAIQVRTQQMQLNVEQIIEEARGRAAAEPQAALTLIKRALGTVRGTTDMDPAVRTELVRRLSNLKRFVELSEEHFIQSRQERQQAVAARESQRRIETDLERDDARIKELLKQVAHLLHVEAPRGNRDAYPEAEDVAQRAVELRPGDGTAAAARFSAEAANQLDMAFHLRNLRADRFLAVLEQVEFSHVPFPDEPPVRYPPAAVWRRLTEERKKWASVDLHKYSKVEERIIRALSDETEVEFVDMPLKDGVDYLRQQHNIQIILDEQALTEEGIQPDEPITMSLSGVSLRSALKIILEPLGLTYVIQDEVMRITTEAAAEEMMSTRVYPVADLVIPVETPSGGGSGSMMGGGGGGGMGGGGMGGGMGGGGMGGGMGMMSLPPAPRPKAGRDVFDNKAVKKATGKKKRWFGPVIGR